jgi:dipeptide transport system substrate-binding protein
MPTSSQADGKPGALDPAARHRSVHLRRLPADAAIRYKANPDYWGGKRKIDDLIFAITTDRAVRAQKLKAGECDLIPYPAPADVAELQAMTRTCTVLEQEGLNIGYMSYNT